MEEGGCETWSDLRGVVMPIVIDDRSRLSEVCTFCSRLRSIEDRRCDAFPKGIPDEIWNGVDGHQQPYSGDHDLLFNWVDKPDGQESEYVI